MPLIRLYDSGRRKKNWSNKIIIKVWILKNWKFSFLHSRHSFFLRMKGFPELALSGEKEEKEKGNSTLKRRKYFDLSLSAHIITWICNARCRRSLIFTRPFLCFSCWNSSSAYTLFAPFYSVREIRDAKKKNKCINLAYIYSLISQQRENTPGE